MPRNKQTTVSIVLRHDNAEDRAMGQMIDALRKDARLKKSSELIRTLVASAYAARFGGAE